MSFDYLSYYQDISVKNIKEKTILFLDHYENEIVDETEVKREILNKFSIQSGKLHLTKKLKDRSKDILLEDSLDALKKQLSESNLIKIKLLIVVAHNSHLGEMQLQNEINKIKKTQQNIGLIEIEVLYKETFRSMITALKYFNPHILHFTGHGAKEGIYFKKIEKLKKENTSDKKPKEENIADEKTKEDLIESSDFARAIQIYGNNLYLIFLNACNSHSTALEILNRRNDISTISYNKEIGIDSAKEVSIKFYEQLALNPLVRKEIENTFQDGLNSSNQGLKNHIDPRIVFIKGDDKSYHFRQSRLGRRWNKFLNFFLKISFNNRLFRIKKQQEISDVAKAKKEKNTAQTFNPSQST